MSRHSIVRPSAGPQQEGHLACKTLSGVRDAGMFMCLSQGEDLHMAQQMSLPLTVSCSSKSRLVLPFWCRLTRVVPDKIQEGCAFEESLFTKKAAWSVWPL